MAMRRRNFNTKKKGTDDVVVLDINGDDPELARSFPCNSKIPGMVLVDFISEMDEDDPASMGSSLTSFFKASIQKDHYEAFLEYVRTPENEVDLEQLAEMAGWLAEQYTGGNPTEQSSGSSDGLSLSGPGNEDVPSELARISQH